MGEFAGSPEAADSVDYAEYRRELLAESKHTEAHPAPWYINALRQRLGFVFVVQDANNQCVAEFDDRHTAEAVVRMWNERVT